VFKTIKNNVLKIVINVTENPTQLIIYNIPSNPSQAYQVSLKTWKKYDCVMMQLTNQN